MSSEIVKHDDREHWLRGRATSIGSSDAAVILGHGYAGSSRYALWSEKCKGLTPEYAESTMAMFAKGQLAEPYIAGLCKIEHDWDVEFDPPFSYRRNVDLPYLTASLDARMVEDNQEVVLEFKSLSGWMGRDWDAKSGKAPLKYTIQVQHQLAVTGWRKGYLIGLHGFDLHVVEVKRHDALIEAMLEEYAEFWQHVVDGTEPEIDGSEATHTALKRVYVPAPMHAEHLGDSASELVKEAIELERKLLADGKEFDRIRNELVRVIGSAEYVVTTDGQWYSFKSSRGGKRLLKPHHGKVKVR